MNLCRNFLIFFTIFYRFSSRNNSLKQATQDAPQIEIIHGEWTSLPRSVKVWAKKQIDLCRPEKLHIMDGGLEEDKALKEELVQKGRLIKLTK